MGIHLVGPRSQRYFISLSFSFFPRRWSHTLIGQEVADGQLGLLLLRSCDTTYQHMFFVVDSGLPCAGTVACTALLGSNIPMIAVFYRSTRLVDVSALVSRYSNSIEKPVVSDVVDRIKSCNYFAGFWYVSANKISRRSRIVCHICRESAASDRRLDAR